MPNKRPIDRFIEYLEYKSISPAKAEKQLAAGNAYIQNSKNRKGQIGSDKLEVIANTYVDLNLIWLVTGKQEMLTEQSNAPIANELNEPLMGYSTNKKKQIPPPTTDSASPSNPQIITVDNKGNENILFVGEKAAVGYLNGYGDSEWLKKQPAFNLPGLNEGSYRAFPVCGNSMSPTLEDKEMVVGRRVEKLDDILEDLVHIVVTKNEGIIVKRLLNRIDKHGYIVAKSDAITNRNEFPNFHIYPHDVLELWHAVYHGGFEFKAPVEIYKRVNNIEADLTEVMRVLKENDMLR